ncbi:putative F-box protein At5g55150 [Tripterygium wilfordii]|uniref:putative F-box protein At5g55150 n=1 Tax=Tripterygium wilfordii TaxID=458696 RepID=UPI0018F7FDDB|nr:putative F-box protein At5g55150 [Tripterygium wilfordii]
MADWGTDLHPDILFVIVKKITDLPDYYRFSYVCRSWRSAAMEYISCYVPSGAPCLMVPEIDYDISCKLRRLLPFSVVGKDVNKEERDESPQIRLGHKALCCGSYQGWLGMISSHEKPQMYLLNPFSDTRIDLPPVSNRMRDHVSNGKQDMCYGKLIFSKTPDSSSDDDCIVMILHDYSHLDFCKLGDKAWTPIQRLSNSDSDSSSLTDAIYFNGKLYVVSCFGEILACDLTTSTTEAILTRHYKPHYPIPRRITFWHLMESRGELFRIWHKVCYKRNGRKVIKQIESLGENGGEVDVYNLFDAHYTRRKYRYKTCGFEVHKLGSNSTCIKVESFDGEAVFLGKNQSFSLPNPNVFGYQGNRIYFSDDRIQSYGMGVFNMEENCVMKPLYLENSQLPNSPPIWVTPK